MFPRRSKKTVWLLLIMFASLAVMGCMTFEQVMVLSIQNFEVLESMVFDQDIPWGEPAPQVQTGPDSSQLPSKGGEPTAPPVAPADQEQPIAPPASQWSVAACDALPYVEVTMGARRERTDEYHHICSQRVIQKNTHPERRIAIIAHNAVFHSISEGPLGGLQFIDPLSQDEDAIWSFYETYQETYSHVDWYAAAFIVPECMWLIDGYFRVDPPNLDAVRSSGLAIQPIDIPSCIP